MRGRLFPILGGALAAGLLVTLLRRPSPTERINRALFALQRYRLQVARRPVATDAQDRHKRAELAGIDGRIDALSRALMDLGAGARRTERRSGRN